MRAVILVKSVQRFLASIDPYAIDVNELTAGIETAQQQLDEVVLLIEDDDVESTDELDDELERLRRALKICQESRAELRDQVSKLEARIRAAVQILNNDDP